jgi:hypothetical protein
LFGSHTDAGIGDGDAGFLLGIIFVIANILSFVIASLRSNPDIPTTAIIYPN